MLRDMAMPKHRHSPLAEFLIIGPGRIMTLIHGGQQADIRIGVTRRKPLSSTLLTSDMSGFPILFYEPFSCARE